MPSAALSRAGAAGSRDAVDGQGHGRMDGNAGGGRRNAAVWTEQQLFRGVTTLSTVQASTAWALYRTENDSLSVSFQRTDMQRPFSVRICLPFPTPVSDDAS